MENSNEKFKWKIQIENSKGKFKWKIQIKKNKIDLYINKEKVTVSIVFSPHY